MQAAALPEKKKVEEFRSRIIRDPLHDLIRIDNREILEVMHAPAFQRLRQIRQLGLAFLVYPGAEHSRFIHALGAYHLSICMIEALRRQNPTLFTESELLAIPLAALCHDIGHGPFSHLFERVTKEFVGGGASHESWTVRILEEQPEISKILETAGVKQIITEIIKHTYEKLHVQDIISSQLDVDRFDYLCRDSLMTGVKYGDLDLSWLLRTVKVAETSVGGQNRSVLALDARRGMSAVEAYILGRHHMYKHVYYHKTIRSAETMLKKLLTEVVKATRDGKLKNSLTHPVFSSLAKAQVPSLDDYLTINDFVILNMLEQWAQCGVEPVADLAMRLRKRDIFAAIVVPEKITSDMQKGHDAIEKTKTFLKEKHLDPDIYYIYDTPQDTAYKDLYHYQRKGKEDEAQDLYCVDGNNVFTLSSRKTFLSELEYIEHRVYVPKEFENEIRGFW
jgi:HD superfamily phosphohydrolase